MTGRIPPYGENFRRERLPYLGKEHDYSRSDTVYVLKRDARWRIQSNRTSEKWYIQFDIGGLWIEITDPDDTFGEAMIRMLCGIEEGYYGVTNA